jgi:hypothetical protein
MPVSSVGQLEQLKKMVDELGESKELSASQVAFLRTEWLHQVDLWDAWSRRANWWYYALRLLIVIGGASLPVLLTLQVQAPSDVLAIAAVVVSAIVAAAAAWEGVANYGQVWLLKCRWAVTLRAEGWRFLHRVGKYTGPNYEQVFPSFVLEVEALIAQEAGDYVGKLDRSKPPDLMAEMARSLDAARNVAGAAVAPASERPQ